MSNAIAGYVADTMAVILWLERRKMPQKSKAVFTSAERNEATIYVPAMVLAEVGYLSEKNKIEVALSDVTAWVTKYNFRVHATDTELIRRAFEITDIPELHDRLIAASGLVLGLPVITNDPKIMASQFVSTVWS